MTNSTLRAAASGKLTAASILGVGVAVVVLGAVVDAVPLSALLRMFWGY